MKNLRLELTIHVRQTAGARSCYPLVASFMSVCVLAQVLEDNLRQLLINHGGNNLIWTRDKSGKPAIAVSHVFPILGGSKVHQLKANLKALDVSLTLDQITYIESIVPFDPGFPHTMTVCSTFLL